MLFKSGVIDIFLMIFNEELTYFKLGAGGEAHYQMFAFKYC